MTIINMTYGKGGSPLQPFHLNGISDLAVTGGDTEATITWSDPGNLVVDGQTLATWSSTKLVRKVGSAPADSSDGTLVLTETVADTYSSNGYVDTGLTNGTTYYYGAFAISSDGLETISNISYATPTSGWSPGVNTLAYYPFTADADDYLGNYDGTISGTGLTFGTIGGSTLNSAYFQGTRMTTSLTTMPKTINLWIYKPSVSGDTSMGDRKQWLGFASYDGDSALYVRTVNMNSSNGEISAQVGNEQGRYRCGNLLDKWTNICVTTNGTDRKIYMNGSLVYTYSSRGFGTANTGFWIGNLPGSGGNLFSYISNVIMESVERTAQDVSDYFNVTKSNYGY